MNIQNVSKKLAINVDYKNKMKEAGKVNVQSNADLIEQFTAPVQNEAPAVEQAPAVTVEAPAPVTNKEEPAVNIFDMPIVPTVEAPTVPETPEAPVMPEAPQTVSEPTPEPMPEVVPAKEEAPTLPINETNMGPLPDIYGNEDEVDKMLAEIMVTVTNLEIKLEELFELRKGLKKNKEEVNRAAYPTATEPTPTFDTGNIFDEPVKEKSPFTL